MHILPYYPSMNNSPNTLVLGGMGENNNVFNIYRKIHPHKKGETSSEVADRYRIFMANPINNQYIHVIKGKWDADKGNWDKKFVPNYEDFIKSSTKSKSKTESATKTRKGKEKEIVVIPRAESSQQASMRAEQEGYDRLDEIENIIDADANVGPLMSEHNYFEGPDPSMRHSMMSRDEVMSRGLFNVENPRYLDDTAKTITNEELERYAQEAHDQKTMQTQDEWAAEYYDSHPDEYLISLLGEKKGKDKFHKEMYDEEVERMIDEGLDPNASYPHLTPDLSAMVNMTLAEKYSHRSKEYRELEKEIDRVTRILSANNATLSNKDREQSIRDGTRLEEDLQRQYAAEQYIAEYAPIGLRSMGDIDRLEREGRERNEQARADLMTGLINKADEQQRQNNTNIERVRQLEEDMNMIARENPEVANRENTEIIRTMAENANINLDDGDSDDYYDDDRSEYSDRSYRSQHSDHESIDSFNEPRGYYDLLSSEPSERSYRSQYSDHESDDGFNEPRGYYDLLDSEDRTSSEYDDYDDSGYADTVYSSDIYIPRVINMPIVPMKREIQDIDRKRKIPIDYGSDSSSDSSSDISSSIGDVDNSYDKYGMLDFNGRRVRFSPKANVNASTAKKDITSYTKEQIRAMELLATTDGQTYPFGSASYKAQLYPGDLDVREILTFKSKSLNEIVEGFARVLKQITKDVEKSPNAYFSEIKAGFDTDFLIDIGYVANRRIHGYDANRIHKDLMKIFKKLKDSEKKEYLADIIENLPAKPTLKQWENLYDELRKHFLLRWTADEVLKGVKKSFVGTNIKLTDALKHETMVKIDTWQLINGRFIEVTNFYILTNEKDGHKEFINLPDDFMEEIPRQLQIETDKFLCSPEHFKPFKALKRMWSLASLRKDQNMLNILLPIINSDVGVMNQINGDIDSILGLLRAPPKNGKYPMDKIIKELDNFRWRIASVENHNLNNERFNEMIEEIEQMDRKGMLEALSNLRDDLQHDINELTVRAMKANGIWPVPFSYLPNPKVYCK